MASLSSNLMDQYVASVKSLTSQGIFPQLCDHVGKSGDFLVKNAAVLDNAIGALDIQTHSLGLLGVVNAKYNVPLTDFEALFVLTQQFIYNCNGEQIRYAPDIFAEMCHKFTAMLTDKKQAIRGIGPLKKAINKLQMNPTYLTSVHADLCQLCLLSKCMKPALELLDVDITEIGKERGHFDAKHLLCYYYYGGMIYTALKKYERAFYFFEVAIATPSMAVSHIMLEAYKKYVLVSLILHGKIMTPPKYTSQVVSRYIKPLCQAYHDVASAYSTNTPSDLNAAVQKHKDLFEREKNMGLVKQCVTSLYKKSIQRLTKTFLTLSLSDMANRVQLSDHREAERYVLNMIEDGEIFASINQKDGMVSFHDNPEKYNNTTMLLHLDAEMDICMGLDKKLRIMDKEISTSAGYIQKSSGVNDEDLPGTSGKGGYTM